MSLAENPVLSSDKVLRLIIYPYRSVGKVSWIFAFMLIRKPSYLIFSAIPSPRPRSKKCYCTPGEDRPGQEGSRVVIGRTSSGRYLRVIYTLDEKPDSVFVITAYELQGNPLTAYQRRLRRKKEMKQSKFPPGWDEDRVKRVLAHYEAQSEDEAVAEDEAAYEAQDQTVMEIPTDLVPAVRELIAKRKSA